jgi:hypothetical protein
MNVLVQHLSHSFRTDAAHLIEKARHANTPKAPHLRTSYIGKLVVDAYMACECALKSMIASANEDKTGTEVYALIIKRGHDLNRLMKDVNPKSISDDDRKFIKKASKLGVKLRYSLDLFSVVTCDLIAEDDDVDFQIDQAYLKKFLSIADSLSKEANAQHKSVFGNGATPIMSQAKAKEYIKALRAICRKQRKKC